ncbi:MAG: DNA polymerase [Lachnospiraceae bacterium]|nr:DNA polymerase [Lachnospiraceae bacterium]
MSNSLHHNLFIDLETFSSIPIAEAGAYAYVASPDFEILLFAYSIDYQPVQVIDLVSGETVPIEIIQALTNPAYTKHSYNAMFEFLCLSKVYGGMIPSQWRCTMIHALYCGYPGKLEAVGMALGMPEEKQKLTVGKALIRYFCVPCKPTKSNGGRTRNYPKHDPEKWRLFKEYNAQDVVTEMEVEKNLALYPVPEQVQKQWETDVTIHLRGVYIDTAFVEGALYIGDQITNDLMDEARQLTGLENPNSIAQLKTWINIRLSNLNTGHLMLMGDLTKDSVSKALAEVDLPDDVRRVLEIRQELGKTSTKKYDAITNCIGSDNRVRGLLQYYGANRTGRWAGRLVQVQNLPRTYTNPIDLARDLVKQGSSKALRVIYGSVNDTLSQLIRTAFIASPGNVLIDADFSAIEARVISWLAGEDWRLKVFRTHGKIYEASASQMFGVPIDLIKKGNPEYALRAKGKVAELALGYQGSVGALIQMGALDMGLEEAELPDIVNRWRQANTHIQELWYELNEAAIEVIGQGGSRHLHGLILAREYDSIYGRVYFTITLPSGRKLFYADPSLGDNQWGGASICYMGMDQSSKTWKQIETYGGKLVENVVQAIARDCLAEAIERLNRAGYPIVFHVHDEVVIDIKPYADNEKMLNDVIEIMSVVPDWAKGLPLGADGWVGDYFTKD